MKITEVRIKLMENTDDRLRAFCSITFDDCFVIRDLKIIEGTNGPFVAMPSRKLSWPLPTLRCEESSAGLLLQPVRKAFGRERTVRDPEGRVKLYADIAHPINSECREAIQDRVIAEYQDELQRLRATGLLLAVRRHVRRRRHRRLRHLGGSGTVPRRRPRAAVSTQIQPAQSTPPPPHQTPRTSALPRKPGNEDGFGAGIFD
jgi:stage V sporulation protein G